MEVSQAKPSWKTVEPGTTAVEGPGQLPSKLLRHRDGHARQETFSRLTLTEPMPSPTSHR